MIRSFLISVLVVFAFISCTKKNAETVQTATEAVEHPDVSYGADAKQEMDVYLPANRSMNTPVIVLLHGGGFVAGDRKEFTNQAKALAAKGYAVLNLSYRLVDISGVLDDPMVHKPSPVTIRTQLDDIAAAVNHARGKTSEWVMSGSKWGIAGHSAGATLALLFAYGDKNPDRLIKAVANWAGATSLAFNDESEFDLLDPKLVEVYYRSVGAEPTNANKLAYMSVSPDWVASSKKNVTPTLNIRPQHNNVIGVDNSKPLYQTFTNILSGNGVPNKYVEIAGADHGFGQSGNWETVYNETDAFFKIHLK